MTRANQSNDQTNKTALAGQASSNVPVSETPNPETQSALDGAEQQQQGDKTMHTTNAQQPGFWQTVKTAFAWGLGGGFGGAIGWRLGNWIADIFGKIWRWAVLLVGSYIATHGGLQSLREALF